MKGIQIIIDPICRINYSSYYIKGFWELYGFQNVKFDNEPFAKEKLYRNKQDYNKCMCLIAIFENKSKKIVIDFDDLDSISDVHYNWCDVYAKINAKYDDLANHSKLLEIGPSFGINIIGANSFYILIKSLILSNKPVSNIIYLKNYIYMFIRRLHYDKYLTSTSHKDYIFAVSTLWYDSLTFKTTNSYRISFFLICKKVFKKVEGGFFFIKSNDVVNQFPKYIEYKKNTKVFF